MLKTIETPALELKKDDLIFDIKPEDSCLRPALFRVLKLNNNKLIVEGIGEDDKGYYFSSVNDKKQTSFSVTSTSTWYKLLY